MSATNTNNPVLSAALAPAPGANLLGEVIAWIFPENHTVQHTDIVTALQSNNLDYSLARVLCSRHAFVRAVRKLAQDRLARILLENKDVIEFQFTKEFLQGGRFNYAFDSIVTLDKMADIVLVSPPDPALQAHAITLLSQCKEARRTADISRIIHCLFRQELGHNLFRIGGAYFIPHASAAYLARVDSFVQAVGGRLNRLPIADGTSQGANTTTQVVVEGIKAEILEAHKLFDGIDATTREKTIERHHDRLAELFDLIEHYSGFLSVNKAILEDKMAMMQKLLSDKEKDRKGQLAAAVEPFKPDPSPDETPEVAGALASVPASAMPAGWGMVTAD